MRILFDTNVIIDAAVPERPHHETALVLIGSVERGRITGLVTPTAMATCWYVATAHHKVDPRPLFEEIEVLFELALMNRAALRTALDGEKDEDFEDAYTAAAGREAGADLVVTRNEVDFASTSLDPISPGDLRVVLQT